MANAYVVSTATGVLTKNGVAVTNVTKVEWQFQALPARTSESGSVLPFDLNCDLSYFIFDTVAASNILSMVNGSSSAIASISPTVCAVHTPYRKITIAVGDTVAVTDGVNTLVTATKASNTNAGIWNDGEPTGQRPSLDADTALTKDV